MSNHEIADSPDKNSTKTRHFLYKKAIDLLSRREHSRAELGQKLRLKSSAEEELVDALLPDVLDELTQLGYLSNERYAEMIVRSRFEKGHGPVRIRLELKQKGIESALVSESLDAFDADWFALAATVQRKRFGESPVDMAARAKQMRFLSSRGFSSDQIDYALSGREE